MDTPLSFNRFIRRNTPVCLWLTLLVAAALSPAASVQAQTTQKQAPVFTSLQAFAGGAQGAGPYGGLAQGLDGNFYGTTYLGGDANDGTIFRVTPGGVLTTLHSFTGTDGANPQGGLILGSNGYLYGTTYNGGTNDNGSLFRVLPATGAFESVYTFSRTDGSKPYAGLVEIGGSLYGTTVSGGSGNGGTLYSYALAATSTAPFTLLHNFSGFSDGSNPQGAPISGGDGNIYGTTATGGDFRGGTVYRYSPGAGGGLTTLHAFSLGEPVGPTANLVLAADGNFYGTTLSGGVSNNGTVFSITPTGDLNTFYNFSGGKDGLAPQCTLVQDTDGTFYGTASSGGDGGAGTVFSLSPAGIFTVLHAFGGGLDGGTPQTGLVRARDGGLYGTTYEGGGSLAGTIYQLSFAGPAGVVRFASTVYNTTESSGTASVAVSRVNGSAGAITATGATSDGTAVAGADYTAVTTTLVWADGDTADKFIQVPILDRGVFDGTTKSLNLALTGFTGGAITVAPANATLVITENDQKPGPPTIVITSPPADLQVTSGAPLSLAASVYDPNALLARVDFFLNGALYAQTTASGPFTLNKIAPGPGTYVLGATAIDTLGRQTSDTRTITVIAPATDDPAPTTTFLSDLGGRTLASGTTVVIAATADSLNLSGEALKRVDFYADTTLLGSFNGDGTPIVTASVAGRGPVTSGQPAGEATRRLSADPGSAASAIGTIFQTAFIIPNLNKLINLLTVATTQSNRSQVSASVTVKASNSSANQSRRVALRNIANGTRVKVGTSVTVPVSVSDPISPGVTAGALGGRRTSDVTPTVGSVSKVEYYLNQLKVATSTAPPYTFDVSPPAAGTYLLEAIVTDDAGLSSVADPVTITAFTTPVVTIAISADINKGQVPEGSAIKTILTRDGDLAQPLTVTYKVKGSNVAGVDYKKLSGTVTFSAGSATAVIKIRTRDDHMVDANKVLKVVLQPSVDGSYALGASSQVKILVLNVDK